MSLDPRKGIKTKKVNISGTQKDFDALADFVRQAAKKTNVDLIPTDMDIPGRIQVRKGKDHNITQWVYPRLQKAMKDFAEALEDPGDGVVDFGKTKITDDPATIVQESPTLRKMNQLALGKALGVEDLFNEDIIEAFESMLDPTAPVTRSFEGQGPLTRSVPIWVFAQDLLSNRGNVPIGTLPRNKEELEKITEVPPDLGGGMDWARTSKDKYNQAYFVILRLDKWLPEDAKLRTKSGEWDRWIKSRPVPEMMSLYRGRPPSNYGELMERFAVYTAARTFGLKDAYLAPIFAGESIGKKGDIGTSSKWFISEAIKSKSPTIVQQYRGRIGGPAMSEYATYVGFVVVGKGNPRTIDLGKEPQMSATEIPGWDL